MVNRPASRRFWNCGFSSNKVDHVFRVNYLPTFRGSFGKKKPDMKRTVLVAQQLLVGQREKITMMDLRKSPGDVFTQVQMGKIFIITSNGKPIAQICQVQPDELSALEIGKALRSIREASYEN